MDHSGLDTETLDLSLTSCPRLNVSECVVSEVSDKFLVLVYNPLSRTVRHYVRVPVSQSSGYTVIDHLGNTLETQLNEIPQHIKNIPGNPITFKLHSRAQYYFCDRKRKSCRI